MPILKGNDAFYEALSRALRSSSDLRGMLTRTAEIVGHGLGVRQVFFFVKTKNGRHITAGANKHPTLAPADIEELVRYVTHHTIAKLFHISRLSVNDPVRRMLVSYHIEVVVPLMRRSDVVGFLFLGKKSTGRYTRRDDRLLSASVDGLVIAIENALAVQEVKDLNESLEQRISAATKELRRSNAELQKLDEAKDEFISMASHQLRTPLTSIKGYISMIMEGDVGKVSKDQAHLLEEAFTSSERMVRLIGDFLNVSRLQTGKFVIDKHTVDLAALVESEIAALESNAASRSLKFVYKKPKNIPPLDLDESKIQQVIMNFADNAIYYSKETSTITVSLKVSGDWVEFRVKDTGIGVPQAQQERLFGKFFRATNARQQRPDGTGVGLFLAKKVVDAHQGEIIFSSTENKGSTFGFRLPIEKLRASSDTN
jgi:signal transduction histidine kinase